MCLGGALVGCLVSGSISDAIGRPRTFQLSALPMIIGHSLSASTSSLLGMLLGRFLVGTGMGLGSPVASLYITEVSPISVRESGMLLLEVSLLAFLLQGNHAGNMGRYAWRNTDADTHSDLGYIPHRLEQRGTLNLKVLLELFSMYREWQAQRAKKISKK
ncbi:hypothetical protein Cni_G13200 [Canna indica]|uniref:Major facilitator superfamily (MFS) profile domain-containing protein n=1 Tax=Canna indica TaxID=4628 RepID=A0AAQ3K9G7_9LILI|nr:hypothetical protein Cni_G13200 [Canna indica]